MGPTKTRTRRTVTLPAFLVEMIGEHIARYPSQSGHVFTSPGGGPVRHRNYMARHFGAAVEASGLPTGLRFHDLRHTCAAILIAQGWNPKQVQERLGHASVKTSLDRYGHLFDGHDTELLGASTRWSGPRACPIRVQPMSGNFLGEQKRPP
jgi:integrase